MLIALRQLSRKIFVVCGFFFVFAFVFLFNVIRRITDKYKSQLLPHDVYQPI